MAVLESLDLVVTVDTSVAHLAGAMAKPVWIMLPYAPDWRWLLAPNDSPWYPTARLFRQSASRDWQPVMAAIAQEWSQDNPPMPKRYLRKRQCLSRTGLRDSATNQLLSHLCADSEG
jgi:hypothetical protein